MCTKYYQISVFVLFICNIVLFYTLRNSQFKTIENDYIRQLIVEKEYKNYILYESLDKSIVDTYAYWGNDNEGDFHIDKLSNCPKLILRYSMKMCKPCLDDIMSAIQEVFPNYKYNDNIIFSCRDLEVYLKKSYFGKINLTFDFQEKLPIEKHQLPYFFILDHDLRLKNLYVVFKDSKQELIDYLSITKKKYLDISSVGGVSIFCCR